MHNTLISGITSRTPPNWSIWERFLIDTMNTAAPVFEKRYTQADGAFIWREKWPGIDGSDDGYESYHNWPLFYALGGSEEIHLRSRELWEAVTRQFSDYGQIYREFDAHYDWMHHGESSIYFYYFGLADPGVHRDAARAVRFAGLYTGEDREAENWDRQVKIIRSPINGSRGPRFRNSWEDWETHRSILSHYPAPFDDICEGDGSTVDWCDDRVYGRIIDRMNKRQMSCDVPLNLTATSLVTHAYLYTGEQKYRRWVLDYLEAWSDRIKKNDGICPDNVGPNGIIGETQGGKWWGGYYGWQWPHGFMTIIQPLLIASMNALLITGDTGYLDIPRGQLDGAIDRSRRVGSQCLAPHRHTDGGWTDYRPISPDLPIQLWYASQSEADRKRLDFILENHSQSGKLSPGRGKGDDIHTVPWFLYISGEYDEYPVRILETQWEEAARRMKVLRNDSGDPECWDVHHWQDINPVHTEALVQLTCGGPQIIYHGGLLHVRLRYFDRGSRRPGLPPGVGALVQCLGNDSATVELVNTSAVESREMTVQAGAFGEHSFLEAADISDPTSEERVEFSANCSHFRVDLHPGCCIKIRLRMKRYCNKPSYSRPF